MKINLRIYRELLAEVFNYQDPEAFASDLSLSSIWGDSSEDDIPQERFFGLMELHRIANVTVRELIAAAGLNQSKLAARFGISLRTVQNWAAPDESPSHRDCPLYIRLMMAECLGLMPFVIEA